MSGPAGTRQLALDRRWPLVVLGAMVAGYVAYFSWLTLRAHDHFVYQAHDLGIYDQAIWNTIHGQPFRSTLEEPYDILLGDHFEPILLLIAPIYALWQSPKTLLLIQTAALALGAIPVYLLARRGISATLRPRHPAQAGSRAETDPRYPLSGELVALGFALVYLLYPPVHSANVFEFHPSALALPLLLYTILFLRTRRLGLYFLFLFLAMGTKEVLPLTTLFLGLYAFTSERQRAVGAVTVLASVLWFVLAVFVIIPFFSPEGQSQYFAEYYGWLGGTPQAAIRQMIAHPELIWQRLTQTESLRYAERLLRPWVYTPLFGLPILLVATPALLLNVLSDFSFQLRSLNFFQYAVAVAPFVIVAAIDGTSFLTRHVGSKVGRRVQGTGRTWDGRLVVAGVVVVLSLAISVAVQRYHGFLPFSQDFYLPPQSEKVLALEAITGQVPPGSSVSTDLLFGPHLSQRADLYLFPALHDAAFIAVDALYRNSPFPPRDRYEALQALLGDGEYGVAAGEYGYLLLERGLDEKAIPEGFYDFAKVSEPAPQYDVNVEFGDELRLLGFDLAWERPVRPHAHLVLYWEALRPIDRDLRLFFVLTDPTGELVPGTEMEFDASVWYPPSSWSQGEVVRTSTLPWSLEEPARFGVAVGVVEGPGFWEVEQRLQPAVSNAPWPLPAVHDGSLVWLATLSADGRLATIEAPGSLP